jgi:hypothetical protein
MQKLYVMISAVVLVAAVATSSSAAVTEAQARAKCAKMAQTNSSAANQQRYTDNCVIKVMASQKK